MSRSLPPDLHVCEKADPLDEVIVLPGHCISYLKQRPSFKALNYDNCVIGFHFHLPQPLLKKEHFELLLLV